MKFSKQQLGQRGEKIAESYLNGKGYKILDKNYSQQLIGGLQSGEIDIVAEKNNIINFIEVKTLKARRKLFSMYPEQKVNFQKQRKLIKTAQNWLAGNKIPLDSKWQIDVISIGLDPASNKAKIRHLKNTIN